MQNDQANAAFHLITEPATIPVPGNKIIHEYLGRVNSGTDLISVARMEAPSGWSEPPQKPEFDEITIMLEGKLTVNINGKKLDLEAGQVLLTRKGFRVQYANPNTETAVYWAICLPAFSPELAGRE